MRISSLCYNLKIYKIINKIELTINQRVAIDEQFTVTTTYIDDKITEQHDYTDQEIEALSNEGCIQEESTQLFAWATSDERNGLRKKIWTRIQTTDYYELA
jgi:hypothetical protein